MADLLIIDNYDSFTHNAVDLLTQLGAEVEVVRNDAVAVGDIGPADFAGIVLSPGPGRPRDAGICVPLIRSLGKRVPILGICLGHQAIAEAYGGRIVRAVRPLHGTATSIQRAPGRGGLLAGLPRRFEAARYHSLVVDPNRLGRGLRVTCRSAEGEIMGLAHERDPVEGVQFHPESYLSPHGPALLAAFLTRAGLRPRGPAKVVR
ncbi:MAG: aminodeoxychorismate/anthranilate synthase component II [Planctomycetota bacterium]|nr:aminodeoxychorismate/anthranilate synthase component II [Planctomycetota bacterium]